MRRLTSLLLLACLSACLMSGCGSGSKPKGSRERPVYRPLNEAYALLDKGQNARAIDLLERIVRDDGDLREPDDRRRAEARVVLASAYMGEAGINVFSIHDAFSDVLFSKSLSDVFFKTSPKKSGADPLTGAALPPTQKDKRDTPVEVLFQNVDEFLNNARRVLVILNRFPRIAEAKWPLVEQALANLDQVSETREVRVYRMFIRLVYVKEVLVTRIIRDSSFATRAWACKLELRELEDSLTWITGSIDKVADDFAHVYPKEASPFVRVQTVFATMIDTIQALAQGAPVGGESGAMAAQIRLREELRCGSPQS